MISGVCIKTYKFFCEQTRQSTCAYCTLEEVYLALGCNYVSVKEMSVAYTLEHYHHYSMKSNYKVFAASFLLHSSHTYGKSFRKICFREASNIQDHKLHQQHSLRFRNQDDMGLKRNLRRISFSAFHCNRIEPLSNHSVHISNDYGSHYIFNNISLHNILKQH